MNIDDLYKKLNEIFIEYTTHNWKNGWQHEGDRLSKELTIQKDVPWNNLFLLERNHKKIKLSGPQSFLLEVKKENNSSIRVDIEASQMGDIDLYYYVDNEIDWLSNVDFIVYLCQGIYDANIKLRQYINDIPENMYGVTNPLHAKQFSRDRLLDDLIL